MRVLFGHLTLYKKLVPFSIPEIEPIELYTNYYTLPNILQKINFYQNGTNIEINDDVEDIVGHGTAVAGIFAKMCKDVEYIIVKIFPDDTLLVDVTLVISALNYIYENIECDVIHLSLGCGENHPELEKICNKLQAKGVILVSAFDNFGGISFPASYESVIGVDVTPVCSKITDFIYVKHSSVNVFVKSAPIRLAWIHSPYYCLQQGSSFSAPFVTVFIIKALQSGVATVDIPGELEKNSLRVIEKHPEIKEATHIPFTIRRAVVFPYNKETQMLIKFHKMLDFEIAAVGDLKHSTNIGKQLIELDQRIVDLSSVEFKDVDTLIVGHLSGECVQCDNFLCDILEKCYGAGVNVYTFDKVLYEYCIDHYRTLKCFLPYILEDNIVDTNFGKLYSISVPVVGVYGTGSKQGKFTLQLMLRKKLMELGYHVGQVGTEPSSLLFGMDGIIPFGHQSTVDVQGRNFIATVNRIIYECSADKDVLLIGSQSGSVPMLFNNVSQITLEQIEFLIAAMADVAVLCVNIDDDLDYIGRSIDSIYGLAQTKVVCLAIFPMRYKSHWNFISNVKVHADDEEIDEFVQKVKDRYGLNSYVIDEVNMDDFVNEIIDALTTEV